MIDIKPEDLLTARKVLTKIMEEHKLNYNNAFTHVKNYITNIYCDIIQEKNIKSMTVKDAYQMENFK
jgi:hypothetical protein